MDESLPEGIAPLVGDGSSSSAPRNGIGGLNGNIDGVSGGASGAGGIDGDEERDSEDEDAEDDGGDDGEDYTPMREIRIFLEEDKCKFS